ncbi:MAG: ABC transporter permease [Desulfovibrio sp.]|nr:ABC transporter permease [Desulfovibrio sp.]
MEVPNSTKARVAWSRTDGALQVSLGGDWELERPWPNEAEEALRQVRLPGLARLELEAGSLGAWDSSLLAFLMELVGQARAAGATVERRLPESLDRLVTLAFAVARKEGSAKDRGEESLLARIGSALLGVPSACQRVCAFFGDVVLALGRFAAGRSAMKLNDLVEAMHECGVRSLPIVAVTSLLFGLILAFVGAVQLSMFGAQIYVAGLVGIGMLRVMGAVMVGIVMSGRVGAAFAALIGTMQVNEEIDALETMGIPPIDYLVLPRMLALSIMVPLLTVFADAMGIAGGFFVAITMLDLTPMQYLTATVDMVSYKQGVVGLVYATVFGIIIAIAGCYHGMRCGRSAQAVGEATTTAVVHSIVGIIVASAVITVICNALQI